ncbi:MAG TPA: hypothetical protein VJS11_09255 [Acidobacteriaceae bacterium]|nr:hypothetical protein [Acidobacteriaceae bacterium]
MRAATIIGIVLIILGVVGFIFGGFSYSRRHQDVDLGPVHVSHRETHTVPISPVLSSIALVGGIVLVVVGARK